MGLISVLAISVFVAWIKVTKPEPVDTRSGCPLGAGVPKAHTIVLVDQTKPLTEDQRAYVKTLILREYQHLNLSDRFSVVGLKLPRTDAPPPGQQPTHNLDFSRCRIEMESETSLFTQSELITAARFNQLMGKDLDNFINELATASERKESPIVDTIDSLAEGVLFGSPQIKRRLVIVSDMAQKSSRLSHYPNDGYLYAFRDMGGLRASSSLEKMQVRVHYLRRDQLANIQVPDHRRFWIEYFNASGTSDVNIGWGLPPDDSEGNIDKLPPIPDTETQPIPPSGRTLAPLTIPSAPAEPVLESWFDKIAPLEEPTSNPVDGSAGSTSQREPPPTLAIKTVREHKLRRYEIDWHTRNGLALDIRRVLLLATSEPMGCYVAIPLSTSTTSRDRPDGTLIRELATFEAAEMDFAQRLPVSIDALPRSIGFCEAVGARVLKGANLGVRYRGIRCAGRGFQSIEEAEWKRMGSTTARSAVQLGVVDGRQQVNAASIEKIKEGLHTGHICSAEANLSLIQQVMLGLKWMDDSADAADDESPPTQ
jgi:hypothetical protein